MAQLRIGFVGFGNQARENLLPAMAAVTGAKVVAICDVEPTRLSAAATMLSVSAAYTDFAEMIAASDVEAIVAACPPQVHAEIARSAIEHRKPVFVEKPPCIESSTLSELAELAARHGVTTGVGLNFRYAEPIARVRSIIESPRFGGLSHLELRHFASTPRTSLWGMSDLVRSFLLAQTIPSFDLAVSLGGTLLMAEPLIFNVEEAVLARVDLRFEGGVSASILTGSSFPVFGFELTAIGRKHSALQLDNLWTLTVSDELGGAFRPGEKRWSEVWQPSPLNSGYSRAGYTIELQAFVDAALHGRPFDADLASMLPTYQIIDAVCTASSQLRETPVSSSDLLADP